jgi:DNA polymerase-3 subunit beta
METQEAVVDEVKGYEFDVGEFKRWIKSAMQAVPTSSSISVLFNVLVKMGVKSVMRSTDQEIYIEVDLGRMLTDGWAVLLEAARTSAFVESLPFDSALSLVVKPGKAALGCGSSHMKLNTEDPANFPAFKDLEGPWSEADFIDIRSALSKVAHARDLSGRKYLTSGIAITVNDGMMELAASDTMRMAVCRIPFKGQEQELIIPSRIADILKGFGVGDEDTEALKASICYDFNSISVRIGNVTISSRLMEDKYPNYRVVMGRTLPKSMVINGKLFASALKTAIACGSLTDRSSKLNVSGNEVEIEATGQESEFRTKLGCKTNGLDGQLIVNTRFVLDSVEACVSCFRENEEPLVTMSFEDAKQPIYFTPNGKEDHLRCFVMPISR